MKKVIVFSAILLVSMASVNLVGQKNKRERECGDY